MKVANEDSQSIVPACLFCKSNSSKEDDLGFICTLKSISCHYFCLLLSSRLVQNGRTKDGIYGFLYDDIVDELKRSKRQRCVYCNLHGASVFCCNRVCRRVFHLPCGKRNVALSLFYGSYQSFCAEHHVKQCIPKHILSSRRTLIVKLDRIILEHVHNSKGYKISNLKTVEKNDFSIDSSKSSIFESNNTCGICYECVIPYPLNDLFWPPCCKGYKWLHKKCIQKLALSAGEYYLRCPLCNNQTEFVDALYKFGIYIPTRDASWEREKGAYRELLERPKTCSAGNCICPMGRSYKKSKRWEILICKFCGSEAAHSKCVAASNYICQNCINFTEHVHCDNSNESDEEINVC